MGQGTFLHAILIEIYVKGFFTINDSVKTTTCEVCGEGVNSTCLTLKICLAVHFDRHFDQTIASHYKLN
jgi:hypothetical protein